MKRARLLIFPMLIVLILCACTDKNVKKEGKLNVVTSFYPMYIATANIVDGVSDINLKNLTSQTTGCLHDYQITTQDMIKLSDADVLVINGGGMENFIDILKLCVNLSIKDLFIKHKKICHIGKIHNIKNKGRS